MPVGASTEETRVMPYYEATMTTKSCTLVFALGLFLSLALAHDKPFFEDGGFPVRPERAAVAPGEIDFGVVSEGPLNETALSLVGRGERRLREATTDVWAHDGYAYLGTFNSPCGNGEVGEAGVQVYDVRDPKSVTHIGALPSVGGSRVNDVKVADLNYGTVLVHSNEACGAGAPGGFEIYDVANPLEPIHLAHVPTASVNQTERDWGETSLGVHNLYLFSQGERDFVAAQTYATVGAFQIFDITDPNSVERVSFFGPESLEWSGVDWETVDDSAFLEEVTTYIYSGYGQMTNRLLHDHYVTDDGLTAYLANWDAGLIRLNLTDITAPQVVSVALLPESEDGEVNSHSVWASADGNTVVEGEEDFDPYAAQFRITSGAEAGTYPSAEGAVTKPVSSLKDGQLTGRAVYVGDGCETLPTSPARRSIALIERGDCTFQFKATLAQQQGYAGVVIFNHAEGGDELVSMGGDGRTGIPGVFVGHNTGLKLAGVESVDGLSIGAMGETFSVGVEPTGWSGLRIWDYSDPADPVLASTFNTVCSAYPDDASCDPDGIYSSHNVIVEGDKTYVSWYAEGVLVIDISDPYNPVEVARYHGADAVFEEGNGGIQDVWGIYKVPGEPVIYASDRNGGLYLLEQTSTPTAEVSP